MARLPRRSQQRWLILSLAVLMVPGMALWSSRFIIYRQLGWLDSIWAFIAPAWMGTSPFFILMFYRAFHRVPSGIYDAARIDGAGVLRTWSQVALPIARPTAIGMALQSFVFYWGDFIGPLLYLRSESHYTLPGALQLLQQINRSDWPLLTAAAVLIALFPILLLLLALPISLGLVADMTSRGMFLLLLKVIRIHVGHVSFLALFLLVAGCNDFGDSDAETLSFMVFGDPAERAAYLELVDAFHQSNPDSNIQVTHIPSPRDSRTRLATEFAAGSPPDVSLMNYRRYASFAARELLEPLGPYVEQSSEIDVRDF